MASKNIKGITIEIGGNTTKLQDALKGVDKQVYSLNSDLKNLNQALKLDPGNTDLLAQKYDVLKRNINETKDKLNTLKEAQRQMGDYSKLTDEQKSSYNALSLEIAKSEKALKDMNNELNKSSKLNLDGLKSALKGVGDVASKAAETIAKVSVGIATGLTAAITAGVKSYADLEVAQKGSERLFGESFDIVKKNAADAYQSLGLSATEYYDQVNTYAVGLKESLGGDSKAAAQLSNDILTAQADIVAATGASTESVQNAFSAVMRGNFTLIDNLRLGIKGSKEGMQEVIDKVNEWNKANGNATNYQMGNYADMQKALVDYVKMQGIAGSSAKQMGSTIKGSFTQMKAALDNFINGTGDISALADTFTNFMSNIVTAVQELAPKLLTGITDLLQTLIPQIASLLSTLIPQLFDAVQSFLDTLFDMLSSDPTELINFVVSLINNIVQFITKNLGTFIDVGLKLIIAIGEGLVQNIPTILQSVMTLIKSIIDSILSNLDLFISASLDIILALASGLIEYLPELIEMIPDIIIGIVNALTDPQMIGKILSVSLKLIVALGKGLIESIPKLLEAVPKIISNLVTSFGDKIKNTNWGELGSNIIKGILDGVANIGNYLNKKVNEVKDKIVNKFKQVFQIHSPSRLLKNEIGYNLSAGIGEGIESGIPDVISDVRSAMVDLNNGIQASVNPIINPTANSNPLYINIDKFYNKRDQDIQSIAEELEYYRKNSALARGGQ